MVATVAAFAACSSFSGVPADTSTPDGGGTSPEAAATTPAPTGPFLQQQSFTSQIPVGAPPAVDTVSFPTPVTPGSLIVIAVSSAHFTPTSITTNLSTAFGAPLHSSTHVELDVYAGFATDAFTDVHVNWGTQSRESETAISISEWKTPGQLSKNLNQHEQNGDIATASIDVNGASLLIAVAASGAQGSNPTNGFASVPAPNVESTFLELAWRSVDAGDNYTTSWTQTGNAGWDSFILAYGATN